MKGILRWVHGLWKAIPDSKTEYGLAMEWQRQSQEWPKSPWWLRRHERFFNDCETQYKGKTVCKQGEEGRVGADVDVGLENRSCSKRSRKRKGKQEVTFTETAGLDGGS